MNEIYPMLVPEGEVLEMIDKNGNEYCREMIKDFINELNRDYNKYKNEKQKYCMMKNILMAVDIGVGGILTIAGVVLEVVTLGAGTVPSIILGAAGMGVVATVATANKADLITNQVNTT